jgi:serine/threonine-protein kinase RsbW
MTSMASSSYHQLASFTVPSEPGNERVALALVAEAVAGQGLSAARLEKLKTAVAEAAMNAIEHGNKSRPEIPVDVEVLAADGDIVVTITDQGGAPVQAGETGGGRAAAEPSPGVGRETGGGRAAAEPSPGAGRETGGGRAAAEPSPGVGRETEQPDIARKLAGEQAPRGWGLFLIRHMVDAMDVTTEGTRHTVRLVMRAGASGEGGGSEDHV